MKHIDRTMQYSSLVLTAKVTRDEAMLKLALPPYDEATIVHDVPAINKLGIKVGRSTPIYVCRLRLIAITSRSAESTTPERGR